MDSRCLFLPAVAMLLSLPFMSIAEADGPQIDPSREYLLQNSFLNGKFNLCARGWLGEGKGEVKSSPAEFFTGQPILVTDGLWKFQPIAAAPGYYRVSNMTAAFQKMYLTTEEAAPFRPFMQRTGSQQGPSNQSGGNGPIPAGQMWKFEAINGDPGYFRLTNKLLEGQYYLDTNGGAPHEPFMANGADGVRTGQMWKLYEGSGQRLDPGLDYRLENVFLEGKLTLAANAASDQSTVSLAMNQIPGQNNWSGEVLWNFQPLDGSPGYFRLLNRGVTNSRGPGANFFLDVYADQTYVPWLIGQQAATTGQMWKFQTLDGQPGYFRMTNQFLEGNFYLDTAGPGPHEPFMERASEGVRTGQMWKLVPGTTAPEPQWRPFELFAESYMAPVSVQDEYRSVFIVAHRVNVTDMGVVTTQGCNAIEGDFMHDGSDDASKWYLCHDNLAVTNAPLAGDWLDQVKIAYDAQGSALSLLWVDIKTPDAHLEALYEMIRSRLPNINIVFDVGYTNDGHKLDVIKQRVLSDPRAGIALGFDQSNTQVDDWCRENGYPIDKYWYEIGLAAGLVGSQDEIDWAMDAIDRRNKGIGPKVLYWTVEKDATVKDWLNKGIDGLIVNSSYAYGRTSALVSDADVHVGSARNPNYVVPPARYALQNDSAFLKPKTAQNVGSSPIQQGTPISLKLQGTTRYLGPPSGDYVTVGGRQVYTINGDGGDLTNDSTYKIMAGQKWLYETAKGNAGFWNSDTGAGSSWKLEKVIDECTIKDNLIRNGDVVKFSNGYWKDNYLCDYGTGYAAAGTYAKPNKWVIEVVQ